MQYVSSSPTKSLVSTDTTYMELQILILLSVKKGTFKIFKQNIITFLEWKNVTKSMGKNLKTFRKRSVLQIFL